MLAIIPVNHQPSSVIVLSKNEHNNHNKSKANTPKNKTINNNIYKNKNRAYKINRSPCSHCPSVGASGFGKSVAVVVVVGDPVTRTRRMS